MSIDTSVDLILKEFPSAGNYTIAEELITPGRPENVRPVPENYRDPVFLKVMSSLGLPPNTMWTHQTEALDVIDNGMSAVLSTQTASGKTLVFQLASLKKIIRDPSARVQVFYPTKALNNDQRLSWRKVFEAAGLPQEQLGLIDGDIDMNARLDILQKARVLIMTPDTVHAWMMSNLKETAIQNFIANIQLRVLDEAHLYDGSFGTTFSYLLRRQKFAQAYLNPDYNHEKHGQIIAASATMDNPDAFLKNLTGNDFYSIGPEWDGSPRYEQKFTMMGVPDFKTKDAAERFLTALGHNKNIPGTTICFVDSRMAVDEIANEVNRKLAPDSEKQVFASYKGGLFGQDREQIENDIRSGACKGVISTSALEVGIDIKGVRQVAMVSLPQDAAAFRQRAGRLRASGHVIIFEEQSAIVSRGLSIKAKLEEPPRQPILYRGNAKLIAEQAVCFLDESEKLGIKNLRRVMQKTKDVLWPRGFIETIIRYLSDQELPEILQSALPPGRIPPQRYHSLRSFDGPNRSIMIFDPKAEKLRTLGDVTQSQALSEAFPGAVIYFRGKPYRVIKWSSAGGSNRPIFTRRLNADEYAQRLKTKGYIKTVLTTYLNDLRITGKRYRTNRNNDFMADTKITVSKSVSGFSELSGKKFTRVFYNNNRNKEALVKKFGKASGIEVSQTTEYKAPPGHAYDTTGLVMRISGKWFTKTAARQIAKMMHQAACEEFKISPKDLQIATRNIKIGINAKDFVEDRAIVICDKTPGSLYLSRKIFDHFPAVITRMIDQCSDSTMEHWILELHDWYKGLRISKTPTYKQFVTTHLPQKLSSSQKVAYSPGSILYWKRNNTDEPLRVRIENVEMIRGVLRYGVREVGWDYNPYRAKGERALGLKPKAKPQGYLITNYVVAANLQEPDAATFRFGIYDTIKKEFIDTAKKSSDNDNKEKGVVRGTSGNAPDAKP